jgi:Zn-finger nucleic acid-binding protein
MKCPNDSATLVMSERAGGEVQYPSRGYDDRDRRYDTHGGYRGKKKQHWLGELFD